MKKVAHTYTYARLSARPISIQLWLKKIKLLCCPAKLFSTFLELITLFHFILESYTFPARFAISVGVNRNYQQKLRSPFEVGSQLLFCN